MPQGSLEHRQRRFHGLAALRQPVQIAGQVKVANAGNAGGIGLRLKIAPVGELRQCRLDFLDARRRACPLAFRKHLVGPQMQPELAFRGGEAVHDVAVERGLLCADVPEQLGRIVHFAHTGRVFKTGFFLARILG